MKTSDKAFDSAEMFRPIGNRVSAISRATSFSISNASWEATMSPVISDCGGLRFQEKCCQTADFIDQNNCSNESNAVSTKLSSSLSHMITLDA